MTRRASLKSQREVFEMEKVTDPVCGMQMEASDAAGQSEFGGRIYYFCSLACRDYFNANPARFTTNEPENQEKGR